MSISKSVMPSWLAIILTALFVVVVRESCVIICNQLSIETASNIVGLIVMFLLLFTWRVFRVKSGLTALPSWLTDSSNKLLIDSGFAFLPISAGAGLLLFTLESEFWGVIITIIISTVFPLWGIAKITDVWLKKPMTSNNK